MAAASAAGLTFALLLVSALVAGCASGCRPSPAQASAAAPAAQPPVARVLLWRNTSRVAIAAFEPPTLVAAGAGGRGDAVRLHLPRGPVALTLDKSGWRLGDQRWARGELTLIPSADGTLTVEGRRYRGRYRFVPRGDTTFDVVNDVDVESYLLSVLPGELPPTWLPETFKAQAVVARTYAIFELKTQNRGHFDLFDDTRSQVYKGMDGETPKATAAVAATRGQVVVHQTPAGWRIFKAYFHSTSGGVTIDAHHAFNDPPSRALSAQSLGDLSKASRLYRWGPVTASKADLSTRFATWGQSRSHSIARIGRVERIEIAATNPYGRPIRFEVVDNQGRRYSLVAEEMRWAINHGQPTSVVFSSFFRPENGRDTITFADGRGWGHGVGMCQFSAEAWAQKGVAYTTIVTNSYPGTRVVRAY